MSAAATGGTTGGGSRLQAIDADARERVELALPTQPELWSLARLTASTVAARLDFDVEAIEDLRLAIDELCTSCAAGAGPLSRLHLCFDGEDGALRIECIVDHVADEPIGPVGDNLPEGTTAADLAELILTELVDAHEIGPAEAGTRRGYLEKRRTSTPS